VEIANANGFRIKFKGKRLTQVHADVWQGIMHLARSTPEGSRIRFGARAFLRLIGRHDGKSQRDQLHSWIMDLVATNVEVVSTTQKRIYFGSIVPEGARDESSPQDAGRSLRGRGQPQPVQALRSGLCDDRLGAAAEAPR